MMNYRMDINEAYRKVTKSSLCKRYQKQIVYEGGS